MTLPIERARSRRPITWLTLIGVVLLPVVIGGILIAALYNPTERLDAMNVAVVNDDEPVTIDGQLAPLGRQLTAGLVEGSDDIESNLTWTISNTDDAADGLADGTYDAVVTIPADFSAAATSTAPGSTPEQATIEVTTAPDSLIVDDAITAQVTQAAASLMGQQLSEVYLENVFLGFTTLGDQLGDAADGAAQLADGAQQAADGAGELAAGARTAADGTYSLADGIRQLASGSGQLATGADGLADGASQLSSGAGQLAAGATQAADGLDTWATGAGGLATGATDLANGLDQVVAGIPTDIPQVSDAEMQALNALATNGDAIAQQLTSAQGTIAALAASCDPATAGQMCADLATADAQLQATVPAASGLLTQADTFAAAVSGLSGLPALRAALVEIAAGQHGLADGATGLATGATTAATGVRSLADGAAGLAGGATQLSSGADQVATGVSGVASGASTAAAGADELAGGVDQLATGVEGLSTGVGELADGTGTLADGLGTAVSSLPSYTDDEADDLAAVVADPVTADGLGSSLFGTSAIPLLATLALWFGGLGSFIALRAVSAHALTSRRPSALLALRSLAPAAAIGAVQGLLVAAIVQIAAGYDWSEWSLFAVVAVVAGIAFAAVNQALVAVFGGAGRWVAALVGVLAVATGIVSTVPGALASVAGLMPTAPAYQAMLAALTSTGGLGGAIVALLVWTVLAVIVTTIAVARKRSTSAKAVLAASPA